MSSYNFNPRDRADPNVVSFDGRENRIRLMARSGGYVMVRKPRCTPFVLTEKQWAKLPLYDAPARRRKPPIASTCRPRATPFADR